MPPPPPITDGSKKPMSNWVKLFIYSRLAGFSGEITLENILGKEQTTLVRSNGNTALKTLSSCLSISDWLVFSREITLENILGKEQTDRLHECRGKWLSYGDLGHVSSN